ncbi:hypothetical protein [Streptomyces mirabilis]|uniref:hypothetical protein n=1 Tax=Streptomyces mirabilis TaxID=68239 RepID=UPI00381E69A9
MTTVLPPSASTSQAPGANVAPGCKICDGHPSVRLYEISTGGPRSLQKADAVAAEAGDGAHVYQSLPDNLYVVVRPGGRDDSEAGQP